MKVKVNNYTFNKTTKTVTFTDYTTIRLDGILLITNVTDNIIIYNFASPTLGGTVSGNSVTLTYDTSEMDNTDKLQIFYDDETISPATEANQDTLYELVQTLQELSQRLAPLASAMNAGAPALRTIPIASVSTAVTGSVTATVASTVVSSLTNFGTGIPAKEMADDINNYTAIVANINNVTA